MKSYNPKGNCSPLAIGVLNDLNTLLPRPNSGKSKLLDTVEAAKHFTSPQEMLDRLKVITGSRIPGDKNLQLIGMMRGR